MGNPHREYKSSFFSDEVKYAKQIPDKPYFENDYRDVIRLLEEKLHNFIRLNERLRNHISQRRRFLENKYEGIFVNLIEFSEAYRAKFILPDFESYCTKFMELLRPLFLDFIKEINFGAHTFPFIFRLGSMEYRKSLTVIQVREENT